MKKRIATAVFVFATAFVVSLTVSALDYPQALSMLKSGADEATIIAHWKLGGSVGVNPEQAAELRAAGASEQLVAMLSISYSAAAPATASEPAPIVSTQVVIEAAHPAGAPGSPITPVPIMTEEAAPALYEKQGWIVAANSDWVSYYLVVAEGNKRLFLSKTPNGGIEIPSGHAITIPLKKETYKLYGDTGRELKVKVRRHEPTRLSLTPFGPVGNSGLTGTSQDRDKVRSEVLFGNYVPPPSVIYSAPVVVAPAPVYVPRPSIYYFPRPYPGFYRW